MSLVLINTNYCRYISDRSGIIIIKGEIVIYAYHIDRSNSKHFRVGDYLTFNQARTRFEETNLILNTEFPKGLTSHGQRYYTNSIDPMNPWNTFYETVFEYERKINFPKLTSRYQSFFTIENLDDFSYWADTFQTSEEVPIWKVEVQESDIFKGDASWFILGNFDQSVLRLAYNARQYWMGNPRPNYEQLPELLVSGNMKLVERVK